MMLKIQKLRHSYQQRCRMKWPGEMPFIFIYPNKFQTKKRTKKVKTLKISWKRNRRTLKAIQCEGNISTTQRTASLSTVIRKSF